jgi:LysR family transcriptional regulator, transcription activator of glutamate synthase operon
LPKSKYHESAGAIAVPVTEDTSYTISLASRNLAQEPKVAQKMASLYRGLLPDPGLNVVLIH